jgi:3-phenylpropionate/trans-cinnamate dioxygenase ferredoxin reductase subunit
MIDVTVVGNGVSGLACARRLAERGARVTLIGPGLPHDRPPLSKRALLAGRIAPLMTADQMRDAGINWLDGVVSELELTSRTAVVQAADGSRRRLQLERLVWATGLAPAAPPLPGMDSAHVNATAAGLEALAPALDVPGRRVVVIGAGLVGAETAATLAERHRVTLCDSADRPLARLHRFASGAAVRALGMAGVRLALGCRTEAVEPGAVVTEAGRIPADVVISATGTRATLPPALGAGATARVDETLAVAGQEAIWACGDIAEFPHPRYGPISVAHWDNARASGVHAADAALGSRAPYQRDPYWFSDIGQVRIQQVGRAEAAVEWRRRDGVATGRDDAGRVACVVLVDQPRMLGEARKLLAA